MLNNPSENDIDSSDNHQTATDDHQSSNSKRDYLLTDENFKLLRQFQLDIFAIAEMTPSFRKLINALITIDNLKVLKTKILNTLSD